MDLILHFEKPWKDLGGNIFEAFPLVERKKYVTIMAWCLAFIFLLIGILTTYRICLFLAFVLFLTLLSKRYTVLTKRGLEIFYTMVFTKSYEMWLWEDIYALTHENEPKDKDVIRIYITKGDRSKRLYFKKEDLENIIKLAKENNRKIKIFDAAKHRSELNLIKKNSK
ncbi:hypothetical protein [Peptoniphilus raoultii]|uniref:hypothetical protein n=1 Tax=Peptoniphilus raoultii TaxID=1776387 RepID=UPI001FD653AA|nr:hypothetical protein [Peptoniphilus raoultii]